MNKLFVPVTNQNGGAVIVLALMLLVILTVMGITSTNTSVVENRIAVNEQLHKMAFNNADSGIYGSAKIISVSIDEGEAVDDTDFSFVHLNDDFYKNIIMGLIHEDDAENVDIEYDLDGSGNALIKVDIRYIGTTAEGGPAGGFVFGEGATAPVGGQEMSIYFRIFSLGEAPRNSATTLSAQYRKVIGVPGGL